MTAPVRARAYISKLPPAIAGQRGHRATFTAACRLVEFGLPDSQAWQLLCEWNQTHCQPAWTERDLRHKLADAVAPLPNDTLRTRRAFGRNPRQCFCVRRQQSDPPFPRSIRVRRQTSCAWRSCVVSPAKVSRWPAKKGYSALANTEAVRLGSSWTHPAKSPKRDGWTVRPGRKV
jgi:hypothetical protein